MNHTVRRTGAISLMALTGRVDLTAVDAANVQVAIDTLDSSLNKAGDEASIEDQQAGDRVTAEFNQLDN